MFEQTLSFERLEDHLKERNRPEFEVRTSMNASPGHVSSIGNRAFVHPDDLPVLDQLCERAGWTLEVRK